MDTLPEETALLYLWQNERTIVIGRNQNPWQECRVEEFLEAGGRIARRLSGGGAVYHDLGNLNFTIILPMAEFDVARQLVVVRLAVGAFGLEAEPSGRNDLLLGGRKFSGNAFYKAGASAYHHGTLLVRADMGEMARWLTVDQEKLKARGVASVPARVVNLSEANGDISIEALERAMYYAFEDVYGCALARLDERMLDEPTIQGLTERFADVEWIYPEAAPYGFSVSERFPWGGVTVKLLVKDGVIAGAKLFTDAMEASLFTLIEQALTGCPYLISAISGRLRQKLELIRDPGLTQIAADVANLICGRLRADDRSGGTH